ncbi:MAG TPA: hypothetical protein PKD46_17090 [Aggregatilineaceae bacterium]|nr:hypothetical protein [Aggregatilineaceae bacterium]
MAWTTPRSWEIGWLVTADDLNTHLRDNLNALAIGSGAQAEYTGTYQTTATGMADLGLQVQVTVTHGGRVLFNFGGIVAGPNSPNKGYLALRINDFVEPRIVIAGTDSAGWEVGLFFAHYSYLTGNLANGLYTFKIRGYVTSGTLRVFGDANRPIYISAVEI